LLPEKKSTERQRKIRPERPIYVPGQSRLSSQQRSNCAELSDTERNSPLRDIPETSQTTLARESDLRSRSTPPVPNDMHKFSDGQANISADLAPPGRPGKVKSEDERAQSRSAHAVARQQVKTRQQPVSETFRHEDRSQSRDKSSSSDCRETTPVAETAGGERKRGKKPDLKRYEPKLRQSQYMADGDDRTSGSLPDRPAEYRQSTMDSSVSGRQFHGPIERPAQHTLEQMYEPKASKGGNVSVAGARKQIQSENVTTKGKQISGTQVDVQARGKTPPAEHLGNSSESLPKERRTGRKSRHNKRSNNQNVKQADEFPQITTELTDDKENAFEQTVEAECESEDEQMEWDYKGDLQINIDGALPVLNWGDIPPPPSDDEWSDEDSCSDAKPTIIPGVKPQRKKSSRKRKKRLKAKQQAQAIDNLTQDVKSDAHPVADIPANDDKWQDETGLDDYRTELESASVARKFEGLVVTNSLSGSSKPSRVDKSQGPKDRHDGSRGTSGVVSVSKSYSKARQQRDQRKQKGNDVGRDVKMNMEANRHERHKPEKSDKILNNNGARGPNMQSGYNNHQRASEGAVTSGKVGGIIHLPVGTSTLTPGESGPEALGLPSSHGRRGQNHARGGRGQGNRTLWDPKHPDANPVASRSRQDSYRSGVSESSNASADHSVYPAPNHPAYQMGTAAYPVEYAPYCQQQSPTRGFYYHDFSPGHAMPVDGYVYAYPAVGYEGAAYPEELYRQGLLVSQFFIKMFRNKT
jgi:hypothetical protein